MRRLLSSFMTFFVIAGIGITILIGSVYNDTQEPGPTQEPTSFVVDKGQSLKSIAQKLEREGIVRDIKIIGAPEAFSILTRKYDVVAKAGEYAIPAGASLQQVLEIIASGEVIQRKITVPEGISTYQALELVRNEPMLTGEITLEVAEGMLAPETYFFQRNKTRDAVVQRMIDAQSKQLAELWEQRSENLPIKTPEEALILASIVEKETGVPSERPMVAAVFVNRLRKGMRLQSDPTIIYGITKGEKPLGRGIRRSELDGKTPYNTYVIEGLPPTPISNPGFEAIKATLNPADSDVLYFVADGTGGHVFSKSLGEHNANVKNWRIIEKQKNN
jgi:UPF0755 protein